MHKNFFFLGSLACKLISRFLLDDPFLLSFLSFQILAENTGRLFDINSFGEDLEFISGLDKLLTLSLV